jgi:hypothetical protein
MATNPKELEDIILILKNILKPGGMIFGFSALKNPNKKMSVTAKEYIIKRKWHGLQYTTDDLDNILDKHFDHIGIQQMGDLTLFRASINPAKKNTDKQRPTLENTVDKKIIIPRHYTPRRFLDFRKPELF